MNNNIRIYADDKIPCNPLLFGEGRQTVGARQVHYLQFHVTRNMGAFFLLYSFSRPVAYMLR